MSNTRRLNVEIPEVAFRRLDAYRALHGLTQPQAAATVLEAGLNALNAPQVPAEKPAQPEEGRKGGAVYPAGGLSAMHSVDG